MKKLFIVLPWVEWTDVLLLPHSDSQTGMSFVSPGCIIAMFVGKS